MVDIRLPSHVARMALEADADSHRWFPDTADDLGFMVLALAGEVGELANLVKKVERGSLTWKDAKTRMAAHMETADIFTYLLDISALLRMDLEKAYYVKRAENQRRFGAGSGTAGPVRPVQPRVSGDEAPAPS